MANSIVSSIKPLGIDTIELAHASWEIRIWRFNNQMIVVIHQTVRVTNPITGAAYITKYI